MPLSHGDHFQNAIFDTELKHCTFLNKIVISGQDSLTFEKQHFCNEVATKAL